MPRDAPFAYVAFERFVSKFVGVDGIGPYCDGHVSTITMEKELGDMHNRTL